MRVWLLIGKKHLIPERICNIIVLSSKTKCWFTYQNFHICDQVVEDESRLEMLINKCAAFQSTQFNCVIVFCIIAAIFSEKCNIFGVVVKALKSFLALMETISEVEIWSWIENCILHGTDLKFFYQKLNQQDRFRRFQKRSKLHSRDFQDKLCYDES